MTVDANEKPLSGSEVIRLCIPTAPGFSQFLSHALELTPFATEFRYPGDAFEPTTEEAGRALALAEELTAWIVGEFSRLPSPDS